MSGRRLDVVAHPRRSVGASLASKKVASATWEANPPVEIHYGPEADLDAVDRTMGSEARILSDQSFQQVIGLFKLAFLTAALDLTIGSRASCFRVESKRDGRIRRLSSPPVGDGGAA